MYRIERIVSKPVRFDIPAMDALEECYISNVAIAREIPYVNFGLMCNRKKQDCEVDTTVHYVDLDILNSSLIGRIKTIKKIQETLLDKLDNRLQAIANSIFYRHQKPWLDKCFPHLNPFISEKDGGFGLNDIGIEIDETRTMGQVRRKLKNWADVSGERLISYLCGEKSEDRMVSILKEKAGNYFPSMRIRYSDEQSINPFGTDNAEVPSYSPTNLWWRLIRRPIKAVERTVLSSEQFEQYLGEIYQKRDNELLAIKYSDPNISCLTHERVERFDSPAQWACHERASQSPIVNVVDFRSFWELQL